MRLMRWSWVAVVLVAPWSFGQLEPTELDQYMLELINRARANPNAEVARLSGFIWGDTGNPQPADLNEGLAPGTISADPKPPLAFNFLINEAAADYSQTLLDNDAFTHTFGGTTPSSRMIAAGYTFAPLPAGAGENLAGTGSTAPIPINEALINSHHNGLFIDGDVPGRGHRITLMNATMREIGIGTRAGPWDFFGAPFDEGAITTQDFAFTNNPNVFLTGVAFNDLDSDGFYSPGIGEPITNANIDVFLAGTSTLVASTSTYNISGGFHVLVAPGINYDVVLSSIDYFHITPNVAVGSVNHYLAFMNPNAVPEPSTIAMMGIVAVVGGTLARRRWKTNAAMV